MKHILETSMTLGALLLTISATPARAGIPQGEIEIPVEAALAPSQGYDDNDNVQIVIHGNLPNSCYTLSRHTIERDPGGERLKIRQFATWKDDKICASEPTIPEFMRVAVPFTDEISVGSLPAGEYDFVYTSPEGTIKKGLNVARASAESVDSLPYAAVLNAYSKEVIPGQDQIEVTFSGLLNSSCTYLDPNVQYQKSGDVYVLLPQVRIKPGICAAVRIPFRKTIRLGRATAGHYLIHIRSMNGKSVNRVVEVVR